MSVRRINIIRFIVDIAACIIRDRIIRKVLKRFDETPPCRRNIRFSPRARAPCRINIMLRVYTVGRICNIHVCVCAVCRFYRFAVEPDSDPDLFLLFPLHSTTGSSSGRA